MMASYLRSVSALCLGGVKISNRPELGADPGFGTGFTRCLRMKVPQWGAGQSLGGGSGRQRPPEAGNLCKL